MTEEEKLLELNEKLLMQIEKLQKENEDYEKDNNYLRKREEYLEKRREEICKIVSTQTTEFSVPKEKIRKLEDMWNDNIWNATDDESKAKAEMIRDVYRGLLNE